MNLSLQIRKAEPSDSALIILRESDRLEALAWAPNLTPAEAIRVSIEGSTGAFTGFSGDVIAGIWGYRVAGDRVYIWLMCSDEIEQHSNTFLRRAYLAVSKLLRDYPDKLLCNYVYRDNAAAKRLLTFLGFKWEQIPGLNKFDFFSFPKEKSCA